MANYYGSARSSYFKVRDPKKFKAWCEKLGLNPIEKASTETQADGTEKPLTLYGFTIEDSDSGGFPTDIYNEETDDYEEFDLAKDLAKHIAPHWVAILQETGAEKLRYLVGFSQMVTSRGAVTTVNINDIYDIAEKRKFKYTEAEY